MGNATFCGLPREHRYSVRRELSDEEENFYSELDGIASVKGLYCFLDERRVCRKRLCDIDRYVSFSRMHVALE